ncbi:MAG: hypothetical protein AB7H97_03230 [Pseudobdellovibrionaceae bacterium]
MKTISFFLAALGLVFQAQAEPNMHHEMQHGFVLSANDTFASHLVATGHHSRQTELHSKLVIEDPLEADLYAQRKAANANEDFYFLFQAQKLDLPSLKPGQVLTGHIVESRTGKYEPKNIIVKKAALRVEKVFLNIENPFFADQ